MCKSELKELVGNQVHINDPKYGTGLYCPNYQCPAQEVYGHSTDSGEKGLKEAFAVIQHKFSRMGKK